MLKLYNNNNVLMEIFCVYYLFDLSLSRNAGENMTDR